MLPKATLGEKIAKVKATRSGHVQEDCEKMKAAISDHVRSLRRGAREVCEKRQKLREAILCEKHTKGYTRRLKKAKAATSNYVQEACEGALEEAARKRRMLPQAAVYGKTAKAKSCQK